MNFFIYKYMTIFISLVYDCAIAGIIEKTKWRKFSLPFDWVVSYEGVSKVFKNDFKNFVEADSNGMNDLYKIKFYHHKFPEDASQFERRVERIKNIMKNSKEEVIFIRKSHPKHGHDEYPNLSNDMTDMEELDKYLKNTYPNLKYKLVLILDCHKCFKKTKENNTPTIKIHNISDGSKTAEDIFNIYKETAKNPKESY